MKDYPIMPPNLLMHVRILWRNEPLRERLKLLSTLLFIAITPATILPLFLHGWYQILAQTTIFLVTLPTVITLCHHKLYDKEEFEIVLFFIMLFIAGPIYTMFKEIHHIYTHQFHDSHIPTLILFINLGTFLISIGISFMITKNIRKKLQRYLKQHTEHTTHHEYMAFLRRMPTSVTPYILKHYPHQQ